MSASPSAPSFGRALRLHGDAEAAAQAGRASGAARRARSEAVRRLVHVTRAAQGLPPTITDVEVLDRIAALMESDATPATARPHPAASRSGAAEAV